MPARRTLSYGKAMEVAAMSLSAREEQILGSIEDGLACSDPKLAWMLATFTRLASGEEIAGSLGYHRDPSQAAGRRRSVGALALTAGPAPGRLCPRLPGHPGGSGPFADILNAVLKFTLFI